MSILTILVARLPYLSILSVDSATTPVGAFPYIVAYRLTKFTVPLEHVSVLIARYNLFCIILLTHTFFVHLFCRLFTKYIKHKNQGNIYTYTSQIYFEFLLYFCIPNRLLSFEETQLYFESVRCLQHILHYAFTFNCVYNNNLSNILRSILY